MVDQAHKTLTPDVAVTEQFLKLTGRGETRFTFVTFDDDVTRMDESLTKVFHGTLAQHFDELTRLNALGAGIFFVVNETDLKGQEMANIVKVRAFFVNANGVARPKDWGDKPPHVVVQTSSPLHWHAYWLVHGATFEEFQATQKALRKRYGTDVEVTNVNKVMRLPGFCHRKREPIMACVVEVNEVLAYSASDLAAEPKPRTGEMTLTPDRDEAERYLKLIGNGTTKFTFQTFDDDQKRKDQGLADKNLVKVLHGSLDQHFDRLAKLNAKGAGIYVTVNETDFKGRSAENIVKVRCLFLDLDGAPLPTDGPEPNIVVETSPERWHVYWLVDDVALEEFRSKQKGLIQRYGGDKSVHDLPRVMRLPGFFHRKGEPSLVRIAKANGSEPHKASEFPTAAGERHRPHEGDPTADEKELIAALAVIPNKSIALADDPSNFTGDPNKDAEWDDWFKVMLAIFRATGGSSAGLTMFKPWSRKSEKHNDLYTEQKWREIESSPPDRISKASVFFWANRANPRWRALIGIAIDTAIEIVNLTQLSSVQYEEHRKQAAKNLNMRVAVLDGIVQKLRAPSIDDGTDQQGSQISFEAIEPWNDAVDGKTLIDDMMKAIRSHVILNEHLALASSLWIIHAHAIEVADHTPRLQIKSPTHRCGKTTLLRVIKAMVPKPINTENITTAALFRLIERYQPTLMIDEADSFLKRDDGRDNEELRGILNAGHARSDGGIIRTVGENFEPKIFKVFGPICFAWKVRRGMQVAETIADRSITIELRRRLPDEKITRLRSNRMGHLHVLGRRAARWFADHKASLIDHDPELPEELNDRAQDNWRLLIAIADLMSKELGNNARTAAIKIAEEAIQSDEDYSIMVLADVAEIFRIKNTDRLKTTDIIDALKNLKDRPWAEYWKGQPITHRGLAGLLKPYGIKPKTIRFGQGKYDVAKGYWAAPILEAKKRFVEEETERTEDELEVEF
jgi:putative DNA primase/helicase